jgi:hypothetical protein
MNEISVSRKDTTSMITIDTYLNGEFLNSIGLMVYQHLPDQQDILLVVEDPYWHQT